MKIQQKPKFQSITLILETKEEVEWLWELIDKDVKCKNPPQDDFYTALSNWFSNQAQLGG